MVLLLNTFTGDCAIIEVASLGSTQGFKIVGENENDNFGLSVSGAGDVNNDGFADIVVGAPEG
eukprot:2801321-Rhodomonas_salina.1